jgi:hypothetical protein
MLSAGRGIGGVCNEIDMRHVLPGLIVHQRQVPGTRGIAEVPAVAQSYRTSGYSNLLE